MLLIGHRGDTSSHPENTLAGFVSAFEKGADGVEMDVQLQDGQLIVVHNYMYDRSKEYPRVVDVLSAIVGRGRIEIEIKSLDLDFLQPLSKILGQFPDADIELTTSVVGIISALRQAFPETKLGVIFRDSEFEDWMFEEGFVVPKTVKLMQLYDADVAHLPRKVIGTELVDALHAESKKVHAHIPRDSMERQLETLRLLQECGVDQATIDDLDVIARVAV